MASSIGSRHVVDRLPCQDAHYHLQCRDPSGREVMVLAASDGAGTATGAHIGAPMACETFARLVGEFVAKGGEVGKIGLPLVQRWIAGVAYRLALDTMGEGRPYEDYACTLLAAIVGEEATAFVQLGDGAIVVSRPDGEGWKYIFWPQHGDYANTTNFVIGENASQSTEFHLTTEPVEEIAIFTDGLENLLLKRSDRTVHAPFFDSMFPPVRRSTAAGVDPKLSATLAKYLSDGPVASRTDDDRTLILASRRR